MILAVLQARMSSTRLPGKVLRPLSGGPMILRQIERVKRTRRIDRLIVAISDDRSDDVLQGILEGAGVEVMRGPLTDVLARFALVAAAVSEASHVVRLTGDCPLADPGVIDAVITAGAAPGVDYASNVHERRTYAKGLDVEVMTREALLAAAAEAREPDEREHVTLFINRRPDRFNLAQVDQPIDEGEVRWTVDRPDDLEFASAVYEGLYEKSPEFSSEDVRAFVRANPVWAHHGGDRRV